MKIQHSEISLFVAKLLFCLIYKQSIKKQENNEITSLNQIKENF